MVDLHAINYAIANVHQKSSDVVTRVCRCTNISNVRNEQKIGNAMWFFWDAPKLIWEPPIYGPNVCDYNLCEIVVSAIVSYACTLHVAHNDNGMLICILCALCGMCLSEHRVSPAYCFPFSALLPQAFFMFNVYCFHSRCISMT